MGLDSESKEMDRGREVTKGRREKSIKSGISASLCEMCNACGGCPFEILVAPIGDLWFFAKVCQMHPVDVGKLGKGVPIRNTYT